MLKKLAAILLVCTLVAALAACGGSNAGAPENTATAANTKESAYEAYTLVAEKLSAQSGGDAQYDIDYVIAMDIVYLGESQNLDMGGNIKMKVDGGKVQYSMVMDMGELGGVIEMYCDGDKAYYVMNGEVTEVDMAMLVDQISNSVNIPEFEKEAIKSFESAEVEGGVRTSLVIDGAALSTFVKDALGGQLDSLGAELEMDISDIGVSVVTAADGNPKSMDMSMAMKMTVEGEEMELNATYEYIFNKLGSGVEIDLSAIAA